MEADSNPNKRGVEAQEEIISKRRIVNMELGALDCPVCLNPLSPPIFQCHTGHFLCSSCHDTLLNRKCKKCDDDVNSFERCFGMEHVVQSVRVPCSNAKYGCTYQPVYHETKKHEVMCPKARCYCPESGCSFNGSARLLMNHLTKHHKYRFTKTDHCSSDTIYLILKGGLHVLHRSGEDNLFFLINVAREPLGLVFSVFCIQSQLTEPKFTCDLLYENCKTLDSQSCSFKVRSSTLSDGVPTGYDLILPNCKVCEEGNMIIITANIAVKPEPVSDSDSDSY